MKLRDGTWLALMTLGLACGPAASGGGGTEGDSEDTGTGSTGVPPNPTATTPTPTTVGTTTTTNGTADTTEGPPPGTDTTTTGPPPGEGCCEIHKTPGCDEPDVVDCVCAEEAFCCAFEWDQNCVDLAEGMCMAVCEGPGTTDTGTTTGSGNACEMMMDFELQPSDATHSGAWQLGMSMLGEGEISVLPNPGGDSSGSILFEPDIPCDDTWYIWVRYFEQGSDDSYFATLDGMPMPEAIFEGDCTGGGNGYDWAQLNWRDQADPPCTYIEDPWAPTWDTGVHQIEFMYRESQAMGRILLTNDPAFVPPP